MYESVKFTVSPDKVTFNTQVNGDKVVITGLALSADEAAAMAYLINCGESLEIEIAKEGV